MTKQSQNSFTRVWVKDAPYNGPVTLGRELGAGGEGSVYDVRNRPDLVAKIYHPERRTSDVIKKLDLMIQYPPRTEDEHSGHLYVAWPRSLVYDDADNTIGFVMPKVNKKNVLFDYYNPSLRKQNAQHVNYASLCKVAQSLAKALNELHGRGYVIGDINESNAYIVDDDHITLIDSDSFQVKDYQTTPDTIYRCVVGKPEYTPPELQGLSFKSIDRAPFHDRFALSIVIYQLLMEGRHPFRGIYQGAGEPPKVETSISLGYFLHSKIKAVPLAPTPQAVPWDSLPSNIRELFSRCFDKGHSNPQLRPEPKEWASVLEQAMRDLRQCNANPNHWYFRNKLNGAIGMSCTWCARPIEAFPAQHKTTPFLPTGAPQTPSKPKPVQKSKPKKSTKLPPPPGYRIIDHSKTPKWIRARISSIYKRPVQRDAEGVVVYRFKGKRYRYKLEFSVVKSYKYKLQFSVMKKFLKRSWGSVVVYRKPRTWYWKKING